MSEEKSLGERNLEAIMGPKREEITARRYQSLQAYKASVEEQGRFKDECVERLFHLADERIGELSREKRESEIHACEYADRCDVAKLRLNILATKLTELGVEIAPLFAKHEIVRRMKGFDFLVADEVADVPADVPDA